MPLIETCRSYVGRTVLVLPYYGYGWTRPDLGQPAPPPVGRFGPEPYHLVIKDLVVHADQFMGASGTIVEAGHDFDQQWCALLLRSTDNHDFTTNPGHYMVWISENELPVRPAADLALYEWVTFDKAVPCLCGYGMAADSADCMGRIYRTARTTRERYK
jgi:hypothetical protein